MNRFQKFLEKTNELLGLPLAVAGFLLFSFFCFWWDASGSINSGVLQVIPLAAAFMVGSGLIAFGGAKFNLFGFRQAFLDLMDDPTGKRMMNEQYNRHFKCALLYLGFYLLLFLLSLGLMIWLLKMIV